MAFRLRRKGLGINTIATQLGVSKSSVSIWCRDLTLTERERERLIRNAIRAGHRGRLRGAEVNRERKKQQIEFYRQDGRRVVGQLSKRDFSVAGIALYWAEGSKKSRFSFVNSEPQMVIFMARWLQEIMGVRKEEFMPRIFINAIHRGRIKAVLAFWAALLRLPVSQFGKPVLLKKRPKKVYENHHTYFGVLALGVRRSTLLKYRVLGLIEALRDEVTGRRSLMVKQSPHKARKEVQFLPSAKNYSGIV